jgi:murein DD-endopeptidase MepM/ murein hydrolase activator NlpD
MRSALALLIALALILPGLAQAKKLYKYRDAEGIWHFTDVRPEVDLPVEVRQLRPAEYSQRVSLQQKDGVFFLSNPFFAPVEVEIDLAAPAAVLTDPPLPRRFIVPAVAEIPAFRVGPALPGQAGTYSLRYRAVLGDPRAQPDPAAVYRPPFEAGQSFLITQGFHGQSSHFGPQSEYAVDVAMPDGTPVCAARAGIVIEVANDFFENSLDLSYAGRANHIMILHADGTMAVYAHLKLESARMQPGMRVEAGEVIAQSGNTGYSRGPHLHFAVQRNAGMELVSIPFRFQGADGGSISPQQGMRLTRF